MASSNQSKLQTQTSDSTTCPNAPKEYTFKILVIGDIGTGKTSIVKRYVHNFFSLHYRATIGVDFAMKIINWDANTILRFQLWDIAGQERFGNMTRVYYKEAAGAVVVFDVTRAGTYEGALKWKRDLDEKVRLVNGDPVPTILLGNKCDLDEGAWSSEDTNIQTAVKDGGFVGCYMTSAKENLGIDDAMNALAGQVLENKLAGHYELPISARDGDIHRLVDGQTGANKRKAKKKCC